MIPDKKTIYITGAASGIGFAMARAFAKSGAIVHISDLNVSGIDVAALSLRKEGYEVVGSTCDVTSEEALRGELEAFIRRHDRLDVLVNNAGIQHVASIEQFPTATFERMLKVMLVAPFVAIKHAFPIMKAQRFGRIINVASINGLVGYAGKAGYNSAKHGLIGLTRVAALEGASHGITVNALCPGYVDTPLVRNQLADLAKVREVSINQVLETAIFPLVPQKRLLSPDEVAEYAVFLASDAARGVTGQAVVMDGGYTAQ